MAAGLRLRQLSQASGGGLTRAAERLHLTGTGLSMVGVLALGWLLARLLGARTLFLMVYAGVLALALAYIASRRRLALLPDRSALPGRMMVGQSITVTLEVGTSRRVSTILLQEEIDPAMGPGVTLPLAALAPQETVEQRYMLTPGRRGVYSVGPLTATWSDPFGLTRHTQVLLEPAEVIVHPATETVHDRILTRMWEDPPVRPPASKPWPTGFEFYGMRDYVPGDDLRRVVWPVVAKTGRMMVRESEQGITDRVVIFVDNSKQWHSAGRPSDTFETAIRTAASVGAMHISHGFAVTLHTSEGLLLRGLRGANARLTFLDALARLELADVDMADVAHNLLDEARTRAHILVVTPHLDAKTAAQLRLVVQRGAGVVVAKVLWEETDPLSLSRAAALGAQIVRVPAGAPLQAVFAQQVSAKVSA